MKFSYNFIQEFTDKKLPEPHKLAELLTMHAFEVEDVEKKGDDHILDIDILPNRAHDSASHIGIAREAAAISGLGLKLKDYGLLEGGDKAGDISVKVENSMLCGRYMAALVKGVKVGDSPSWLKERLEALGINSINNVVDAANYVMLTTGQPLHVFDYSKISGKKIIVREAKKGETIQSLDGDGYILDSNMLVIADDKDPLAIAGIKGGVKAEVTEETKDIVIESANFDPVNIRRTSQDLGLRTDASWRFEHRLPATLAGDGLSMMLDMVDQLAGGKPEKDIADVFTNTPDKKVVKIDPQKASKVLGVSLAPEKIESILSSLGFVVSREEDGLQVEVPDLRLDVEREEDLIEEVGRMFGYENADPQIPHAALYPARRNTRLYWLKQIRRHLAAAGFNEVYNYVFVGEKIFDLWGFKKNEVWELENPANDELRYMRPSVLPLAVKTARENLKFYDEIEFFEVGEVFNKDTKREESRLCIAIGSRQKQDVRNFYRLKGEIEYLFHSLGLSDIWFDDVLKEEEEKELSYLHPLRRAQIKSGDDILGTMGQIHPAVSAGENFKGILFTADLDLGALIAAAEEEEIYSPVSEYPQVVRDISIVVPKNIRAGDVMNAINTAGGELLRDVDMFDYYDEIENTEFKSMAFHLIFQAPDRTLRSEEVDSLMAKISHELEAHEGWDIK